MVHSYFSQDQEVVSGGKNLDDRSGIEYFTPSHRERSPLRFFKRRNQQTAFEFDLRNVFVLGFYAMNPI